MDELALLRQELEREQTARLNAESLLRQKDEQLSELRDSLRTLTERGTRNSALVEPRPGSTGDTEGVVDSSVRLRLQGEILEQIVLGQPLNDVLDQLCRLVEAILDGTCCLVSLIDSAREQVQCVSGPNLPVPGKQVFSFSLGSSHLQSIGKAIQTQQPVFFPLLANDLNLHEFPDLCNLGYQAFWSYPVCVNQETVGCFSVLRIASHEPGVEEQAVVETAANLAGLASKRQRDEQILAQTLVRAESASRAKTEFLANMSHEIRTPLTAITGYADLLSTPENRSPEDVRWARQILRSARHLGMLLDDILDLSKVEAGRLSVDRRLVDYQSIIQEVGEMFRPQVEEKLLQFAIQIAPGLPRRVMSDPTRIRQVLTNLVSNAVKFTEKGEIQILAERVQGAGEISELHVSVTDTGVGMTPEQVGHLFQPFERLHQETLATPGTGLGLAISKRLVELMGGRVEIDSCPGRGTRFTLVLPIGKEIEALEDDLRRKSASSGQSSPTGSFQNLPGAEATQELRGLRVLLVEDNPDNVSIFTHLLVPFGIQISLASNGQEAVSAVVGSKLSMLQEFDVILMDMQMPVMDGFEATRRLRKSGIKTPIIALSAFAMASDRERCLRAGCNSLVTKPVLRQQLVSALLDTCWLRVVPAEQVQTESPALAKPQSTVKVEPFAKAVKPKTAFEELVERYRVSMERQLAALESAESRNDTDEIGKIVHRLHGTASSYGFPEITQSAANCEKILRDGGNLAQVQPDLTQLKQHLEAALAK